jgi:hypothetical protein
MPLPLFARTVTVGEYRPPADRVPIAAVDHGAFDVLLGRYVDDRGRVAYADWKACEADVRALHDYLAAAGRADPGAPAPHEAVLAFWINVYNALTLAGVLHVYPTASVRDHTGRVLGFNLWKNYRLHLGGKALSLSDIEHGVLRRLDDPRVHFGLVCGAKGCPALARQAYTADAVNDQLDAGAREFLARPDGVALDPARRVVTLSKLFRWYGSDFAPTRAGRLAALRRFLPAGPEWDRLAEGGLRAEYLPYDWALNDRPRE